MAKSSAPVDPAAHKDLAVGLRVGHMRFGSGRIVSLEGAGADMKAEIDFDQGGVKKLLLRFAKLNIIKS